MLNPETTDLRRHLMLCINIFIFVLEFNAIFTAKVIS